VTVPLSTQHHVVPQDFRRLGPHPDPRGGFIACVARRSYQPSRPLRCWVATSVVARLGQRSAKAAQPRSAMFAFIAEDQISASVVAINVVRTQDRPPMIPVLASIAPGDRCQRHPTSH